MKLFFRFLSPLLLLVFSGCNEPRVSTKQKPVVIQYAVSRVFTDGRGYAVVIDNRLYALVEGAYFGKSKCSVVVDSVVANSAESVMEVRFTETPVSSRVAWLTTGKKKRAGVATIRVGSELRVERCKSILYRWQGSNEIGMRGNLSPELVALGFPDARR